MGLFSKKPAKISDEEMLKKISGITAYGPGERGQLQTYMENNVTKYLNPFDAETKSGYVSKIKEALVHAGHKPDSFKLPD